MLAGVGIDKQLVHVIIFAVYDGCDHDNGDDNDDTSDVKLDLYRTKKKILFWCGEINKAITIFRK